MGTILIVFGIVGLLLLALIATGVWAIALRNKLWRHVAKLLIKERRTNREQKFSVRGKGKPKRTGTIGRRSAIRPLV